MTRVAAFAPEHLAGAQTVLREAFFREGADPAFNEWTFAARVPDDAGFVPGLCLVALERGEVVGYNICTRARIGGQEGLGLGPIAVRADRRGRGVGSLLVREAVGRAGAAGFPWIALLGGGWYARFGFEKAMPLGVTVPADPFAGEHAQILFLHRGARLSFAGGDLRYCAAFYDEDGRLL